MREGQFMLKAIEGNKEEARFYMYKKRILERRESLAIISDGYPALSLP